MNKRIFNSVEEIKDVYGVDVKPPKCVPEGCNVVSYEIIDLYGYHLGDFYKETSEEFLHLYRGTWFPTGNVKLIDGVSDNIENEYNYIYLRLTQQEKKKKFTPERLLGVETNVGFITSVVERYYMGYKVRVATTNGFSYFMESLEYYISDESDETVPFDEYVDIFYERASL